MNVKSILVSILTAVITFNAAGQHSFGNSFKLTSAGFYIKNRETMSLPDRQLGISYERKIYKNIYAGAAFQKWKNWKKGGFNKTLGVGEPLVYKPPLGMLWGREDYKMADIYFTYRYNLKPGKHIVSLGLGASYCWGVNKYLDWYIVNPNPPYDAQVFIKEKKVDYYGFFPQISYDYPLLKNRLMVGADLRGRYYISRSPAQYDYGLHAGFNF